jgi:porin
MNDEQGRLLPRHETGVRGLSRTARAAVAGFGIASFGMATFGMASLATPAFAQSAGPRPVGAESDEINPKIAAGVIKPAATPGFNGPLATFAAPLAAKGITFHVIALDFAEVNPSAGLQRGRGANSAYIIEGVDFDLAKLWGLPGTSLHYENVFFAGVRNLNIAPQIGDSTVGYQPPFTPRIARLSRATVEQKLLGGRLDVEAGMTHPGYYYSLFNCDSINTCFQSILFLNAGYTSYKFAVPGANVAYSITPSLYVQAGAFAVQPNANFHVGYDFPDEKYNGVIGIAEIGQKTDFSSDPYPFKIALTGFINTSDHTDFNAATAFTGTGHTVSGTSGVVLEGEKVIWRRDGGSELGNPTPTALKLYGSIGTAVDSTIPVQSDMYVGLTLLSPFVGRPADRFGLKFNWERLNANYAQYLTAANVVSGGAGSPYDRNKFIFEANAHLQLPLGMAFEPVIQYAVNPNSYYNPLTPTKAHNGVYLGGTYVVPIGVILGLAAAS